MNFSLNQEERIVTNNGKQYHLTPKEYEILQFLMDHPDEFFTPEEIYTSTWKEKPFQCRPIISVHVRHIREKIEEDPSNPKWIRSFWGRGYRFDTK